MVPLSRGFPAVAPGGVTTIEEPMKKLAHHALIGWIVVCLTAGSAAQLPGFSPADSAELASYRLTMETVKKVHMAMRSVITEMKKDPKYQALLKTEAEIEALQKKEELTDAESERLEKLIEQRDAQKQAFDDSQNKGINLANAKTLSEMEAQLKRHPQAMAALTQAGLSPREFSKFMTVMLMSAMAAGFQKSGMLKEVPKELKELHPDNIKFVLDNQAELEAMQKELAALGKGMK
jgi:hypothetical protein